MRRSAPLAVLGAILLGTGTASAQVFHLKPAPGPSRSYLGGGVEYGQPQGEFADFVGHSWGVGGNYIFRLDHAGILGLRADVHYLNYGHERNRALLSQTIGGRIDVDVTTDNNILLAGIGPQLLLPTGAIRPYLTGNVGLAYFFTKSSVEGTGSQEAFASTTNFDDAVFAWSGAAGLYIPLRGGMHPISLDLGARYQANGNVRYLRKGSITDNPDGTISFIPIRSQANMIIYHVGVMFGL
ncbi:MAG TPA: hypothetical protein VFW98_18465 [Gemmatimonadaceae bacterium]|nr:hypothetical protein [Gemmatimonadaceae bacterium]